MVEELSRHVPSFLESQNIMCVFFGLSSASSKCNVPFNFSIFYKSRFMKLGLQLLVNYASHFKHSLQIQW